MVYVVSERFRRRADQNIVLGYKRELEDQSQMEYAEFLNDMGYIEETGLFFDDPFENDAPFDDPPDSPTNRYEDPLDDELDGWGQVPSRIGTILMLSTDN